MDTYLDCIRHLHSLAQSATQKRFVVSEGPSKQDGALHFSLRLASLALAEIALHSEPCARNNPDREKELRKEAEELGFGGGRYVFLDTKSSLYRSPETLVCGAEFREAFVAENQAIKLGYLTKPGQNDPEPGLFWKMGERFGSLGDHTNLAEVAQRLHRARGIGLWLHHWLDELGEHTGLELGDDYDERLARARQFTLDQLDANSPKQDVEKEQKVWGDFLSGKGCLCFDSNSRNLIQRRARPRSEVGALVSVEFRFDDPPLFLTQEGGLQHFQDSLSDVRPSRAWLSDQNTLVIEARSTPSSRQRRV